MYFQALYAIPQVRETLLHFASADNVIAEGVETSTVRETGKPLSVHSAFSELNHTGMTVLGNLFKSADKSPLSFVEADDSVKRLGFPKTSTQLPPGNPTISMYDLNEERKLVNRY